MVDFAGSHVVVTGGTGALGRAVVAALRAAGAVCHVPNLVAAELADFPYANDAGVRIARDVDVADEGAVRRFYQALPPLWASIHLAGGFAMAPVAETSAGRFHRPVPHERAVVLFVLGRRRRALSAPANSRVPAVPKAGASSMSRPGRRWSRGSAPA